MSCRLEATAVSVRGRTRTTRGSYFSARKVSAALTSPPTANPSYLHGLAITLLLGPCIVFWRYHQPGRPPRKRIEVEGGAPAAAKGRQPSKPAKQAAATSSAAASARAQAAARSASAVADRRPSTARASGGSNISTGNGSARGRRRPNGAAEEARFRSRREQDARARGGYAREDDVSSDGEMEDGHNAEAVEDAAVRPGSAGRSAGRGSRHGRRYVGGGGAEGAKRSSRSSSSAGSEESFVEGQATSRWDPLTPPDRRLRAAGSPGCVCIYVL